MSDSWKLVVGLEVHIELETKTKMFCGCLNDPFQSEINSNVCPVCYGLPGALPVANKTAVELTIKLGQALKGKIAKTTFWARKNYFYPDLPKGYQISQSTAPIVSDAVVSIEGVDYHIERIHLEEDAGKLSHGADGKTSIDYNRAGVPLIEIVTKPDFRSKDSAKRFCQELQRIVRHLKISNADMEKGQMRCEANISVTQDLSKFGNKVEVKNINSFKAVEKAIEFEYQRQIERLERGEVVIQETRTYNDEQNKTISMRTKETSADYRYFPEPDLPQITLEPQESQDLLLPEEMRQKLLSLGVNQDLATKLVDKGYYQKLMSLDLLDDSSLFISASNLFDKIPELIDCDNQDIIDIVQDKKSLGISDITLAERVVRVISEKQSYRSLFSNEFDDTALAHQVVESSPDLVSQYQSGNEKVIDILIGKGRKISNGNCNIQELRSEIIRLISQA